MRLDRVAIPVGLVTAAGAWNVVVPSWVPASVRILSKVLTVCSVGALFGAACSSGSSSGSVRAASSVAVEQVEASPVEPDVLSAIEDPYSFRHPEALIDVYSLVPGGPPPDGIPAIDEPTFLRAGDVEFLADEEPVLALRIGDDARAYPVQVLIWHEIVNDTVEGIPVAVTYCPLCNSAIAFDRRAGGRVLSFGVSGILYRSAMVMFDRQTETLWTHFTGEAAIGHLTGEVLESFPLSTVSWAQWRDANPDGLVLSRDTGHDRDYGRNPYPGYDQTDVAPFLLEGEATDGRLVAKQRVVAFEHRGEAVAVDLEHLAEVRVEELEVGGGELVVWQQPGTASSLEADDVAGGRDVGATGVFERRIDGRVFTFEPTPEGFRDRETGSAWNVLGESVAGPLVGARLRQLPHVDTFWFAWASYQPGTRVVPEP